MTSNIRHNTMTWATRATMAVGSRKRSASYYHKAVSVQYNSPRSRNRPANNGSTFRAAPPVTPRVCFAPGGWYGRLRWRIDVGGEESDSSFGRLQLDLLSGKNRSCLVWVLCGRQLSWRALLCTQGSRFDPMGSIGLIQFKQIREN